MSENEALRMALIEVDRLRMREAQALRDTRASFRVLDGLMTVRSTQEATDLLVSTVREEFAAAEVMILRATSAGKSLFCVAQSGQATPKADVFATDPSILLRPRRMLDVSCFGPALDRAGYTSALIAPLPIEDSTPTALVVLFSSQDAHKNSDLVLLSHLAQVAVQPIRSLRLAQRNAELVALIEGHVVDAPPDRLDPSLHAINRAYDRLTQGQALIVDLLNSLLTSTPETLDRLIQRAIAEMGCHFQSDRCFVLEVMDGATLTCTHEWAAPGIPTGHGCVRAVSTQRFENWMPQLLQGQEIHIHDTSALAEGSADRRALLSEDAKSVLIVPMVANAALHGIVVHEMIRARRSFLRGEVLLLRSVSNAICAATRQISIEQRNREAQQALNHERNRLKATLSALPDLVVELDDQGRFVDHYSRDNTMMNQIASALMGRTLNEALDQKLATQALGMLNEVKETGHSSGLTFQYDIGSGDLRWIRASATRREANGPTERPGYLFVLRDVTRETVQAKEIALLGEVAKRASNLIVVTDRNRCITWINPAFERVTGWSRDEVMGRNPASFLQDEMSSPTTKRKIADALAKGLPVHAEMINVSKTGRHYWIELDIQPMYDEQGNLTGYMAIETEITDRKRQELALEDAANEARQAQERLIAAVETLQDGFVLFDRDNRLVICNERYRTLADDFEGFIRPGVTQEEILRHSLAHGRYLDAVGREDAWLAERLASRMQNEVSFEMRLSNGRYVRVFDKATPDGCRVGLRIDITALKEAEASALSDRAAAMDASHDGMAITDRDGNLLYANAAFLDIFSATSASIIRSHWTTLFDDRAAHEIEQNGISQLLETGENWRGEVTFKRNGSALAEIELSLTRRNDGALVWVVRDLAERRQAEMESNHLRETLQIAQRREVIGQLAAGLAHDFNNLIAAISGSATLILDDSGEQAAERARAHADRILKSAERAEGMVRRLLALGARPQQRSSRNLNAIVREAADLLRPGLGRSIRLSVDLPTDPLMTDLEPTDVLQIILNLGINARDAMLQDARFDAENHIRLDLHEAGEADLSDVSDPNALTLHLGTISPGMRYACLIVEDTGPGIDANTGQQVFTPYFSTKGNKGSGLGLSIVAGVIKAAQGAIFLKSQVGAGTRFKILLPLSAPIAAESLSVPLSDQPTLAQPNRVEANYVGQPLAGVSILIVDDDEDVLSVVAALLERAGAEVAPTSDAMSALEVLMEDPDAFDLVITDFDMGATTGADLARSIHERAPSMPVILVTALPDWRQRDTNGGADPAFFTVLAKPLSTQGLVDAAIAALDSR